MKEKNTQNAVVPTKDTRQYKHTPEGTKRRISKIFAFVACVLLLISLAVPTSAYTIVGDDAEYIPVHPYAPDVLGLRTQTGEIIVDHMSGYSAPRLPEYISGSLIVRYDDISQGFFDMRMTAVNDYFDAGFSTVIYDLVFANNSGISLYYEPFRYDPSFSDYMGNIYYRTDDSAYYFRTIVEWEETRDGVTEHYAYYNNEEIYDNFYVVYPADILAMYSQDRPDNSIISNLSITVYPSDEDAVLDPSCVFDQLQIGTVFITDDTPVESYLPVLTEIEYQQVVNSRTFSDLLDWLGDALAGLFSTPLFSIGNLDISIGLVCATVLGLVLIPAFLKFFSGG